MVLRCPLFVNFHTLENVNAAQAVRGSVVKKSQNLVNVVCERPLGLSLQDIPFRDYKDVISHLISTIEFKMTKVN